MPESWGRQPPSSTESTPTTPTAELTTEERLRINQASVRLQREFEGRVNGETVERLEQINRRIDAATMRQQALKERRKRLEM